MTVLPDVSRSFLAALLAAVLLLLAGGADAHFVLNGKNRIILIERGDASLTLFMRIPGPLIYARELAKRASAAEPVDAPFVESRTVGGQLVHVLDLAAIRRRPGAFAAMIASGYRFSLDGVEAAPKALGVAVHRTLDAPPFGDPASARASLAAGSGDGGDPYVGEADVDVAFAFEGAPGARFTLVSVLPELALPPGVFIDNHVVDFRGGGAQVLNIEGQMQDPVTLDGSAVAAALTFVKAGIGHILEGTDHVLFVLCLTIGATSIGMLLWQVTGFTIGHSITLIAGFLGFAPSAAWFTPTVEMAIALSIVYAGLTAIWLRPTRLTVLITAAIGLLHGFGFSFVLGEILGHQAPHLLLSLISFNVGVEIGQVAIVVLAYGALHAAGQISLGFRRTCRIGVAGISVVIACVWVAERAQIVARAIGTS